MFEQSQDALLKLFNAVQVENKKDNAFNEKQLARMISNGYVFDLAIKPTDFLMKNVEEIVGIGGAKMNASFHKSWEKVSKASDAQLLIEQILHYITTYGFEAMGVFSNKTVYIPAEELDIPSVTNDIPLIVIKAMTAKEILAEIVKLASSGIALSKDSISWIMEIIRDNEYDYDDYIDQVKNRELLALLYEYYDITPSEPVEYLRYVIAKLTGESLLIKNNYLISKIKESNQRDLDKLIKSAPRDLASIFLRYKPLFLAMKSVSKNKTFFNHLRKQADSMREALPIDYLNNVTNEMKQGSFRLTELKVALPHYNVWRKIRLAYALKNRLHGGGESVIYKVRNGKGWLTDFSFEGSVSKLNSALVMTLKSIAADMVENVAGKTFYIPENVHYALPATEKQFTGNVPANTYVSVDKDLIVGAHWYDVKEEGYSYNTHRIDIDLSLTDVNGKYGWDGGYRNSNRSIMFSGDMTSAPLPNGATELFYLEGEFEDAKLIVANYFNYDKSVPVPCQLVVAQEKVGKDGFDNRNYMIDPSNIIMSQNVTVDKKQNVIGLLVNVDGQSRVYFSQTSIGDSISMRDANMAQKIRDFFVRTSVGSLELNDLLIMAGATIVNEITSEDLDYVDLSPEALDKSTIINLFSKGE